MSINVAVYGTLRADQSNHSLLRTAKFLGNAKTNGTMYSLGGFPALDISGDSNVVIEVYSVDERTLNRLDMLEGYPSFYDRSEIETPYGKAWIYHIEKKQLEHRPIVESGDWAEYRNNRRMRSVN